MRQFEVVTAYQDKDIKIPERKTAKSACYDLECAEDTFVYSNSIVLVPTGLKACMEDDEVLQIFIRSSIPGKKKVTLANCTGIIDADYYNNPDNEGHIFVALHNFGIAPVTIKKGERIAQAMFTKYLTTGSDAAQGERKGGFGSTDRVEDKETVTEAPTEIKKRGNPNFGKKN
jgi:dUTP pyrophosphatase